MALKGKLKIEGVKDVYTVVECEYYLHQNVNSANGLPQSGIEAGQIIVTIATPSKGLPLYEWMLDEFHFLNGMIDLITNVNSHNPAHRTIWFENAKCVNLYEYFNSHNSVMMTTQLTIQPAKMGFVDGQELKNNDGNLIGYDFRNKRKTVETEIVDTYWGEEKHTGKLDMNWRQDRRDDYVNQILNDPNY